MAKFFYDWEDTSDRFAPGVPDLGRHSRLKTKVIQYPHKPILLLSGLTVTLNRCIWSC